MKYIQALVIAALAAVPEPVLAAPGGAIGMLRPGSYVCELPGDAAGPVGHPVDAEAFVIIDAKSYGVGDQRGTYLLLGDALTMTSGPKRGQTFHRLSSGFLRRTEGGADTALRCIRRVSDNG